MLTFGPGDGTWDMLSFLGSGVDSVAPYTPHRYLGDLGPVKVLGGGFSLFCVAAVADAEGRA